MCIQYIIPNSKFDHIHLPSPSASSLPIHIPFPIFIHTFFLNLTDASMHIVVALSKGAWVAFQGLPP